MSIKLRPNRYALEKVCKGPNCEMVGLMQPASSFNALGTRQGGGTVDVCKACVGRTHKEVHQKRRALYEDWLKNGRLK